MNNRIFEVKDKRGKIIYLTKERWGHIRQKHPNVINSEYIEGTIKNPVKAITEEDTTIYYNYFKHKKEDSKYLKVIVKYLNSEGYVITAYFVKYMLK